MVREREGNEREGREYLPYVNFGSVHAASLSSTIPYETRGYNLPMHYHQRALRKRVIIFIRQGG